MILTGTGKASFRKTCLVCFLLATSVSSFWPKRQPVETTGNALVVEEGHCLSDLSLESCLSTKKKGETKSEKKWYHGNEEFLLKLALGVVTTAIVAASISTVASTQEKVAKEKVRAADADNTKVGVKVLTKGISCAKKQMDGMDLAFHGIKLTLSQQAKRGKDGENQPATRTLLDGSFRGRVSPGRMLAIMGPSGAGKSVFLHALAGRLKADSKLSLSGDRFANGELQPPDRALPAAFVEQEVNYFPRMTVRETLDFRVALHFGDLMEHEARKDLVDELLAQLGLTVVSDTIVGDQKVRGISSGERKRLSIAVEMISSPNLVCCDEPTSSLDSTAAAIVIEKLRGLARQGKTVICVIHQPSSGIFAQFDDVLLVSEGRQLYFGPVSHVRRYMDRQGYCADDEMGTAEHILECVSPLPSMWESSEEAQRRIRVLAKAAAKDAEGIDLGIDHTALSHPSIGGATDTRSRSHGPRTGIWTQFKLLLRRALAETFRGRDVIMIKTLQQAVVASIYGGIYSLGSDQSSIIDRFGLLSLTAIGGTNMAIATTLRAFPSEKTIASGEIAIHQYKALPYFAAKAISEFPLVLFYNCVMGVILFFSTGMNPDRFWTFLGLLTLHSLASEASGMAVGAVSFSSDVALAIFPAILILNVIFDGQNISIKNVPYLLRWIPEVSLIRWGYEGLVVNEFEGLNFTTTADHASGPVAATGKEALALFGMENASIQDVVRAESIIMVVCWCLAYVGLTLTKQKFLHMAPTERTKSILAQE